MRYEDEPYVRLFTRDTTTWKMLPWQSKCVLPLILRKLDRAGIVDLGDDGMPGLAALVEIPLEIVEAGLPELLRRGTLVLSRGRLTMPNFMAAQEARSSDRARKQLERARERARAIGHEPEPAPNPPAEPPPDEKATKPSEPAETVTPRHAQSQQVTLSLAEHSKEGERPPARDPVQPTTEHGAEPRCGTVERLSAFAPDEALTAMSMASNGLLAPMASAAQMRELRDVARSVHPSPLTVEDFRAFGEAFAAKETLAWMERPPKLGQLLANGAKQLLEGIAEARAWKARARPKLIVVPQPPAPVTDADRAGALAAWKETRRG